MVESPCCFHPPSSTPLYWPLMAPSGAFAAWGVSMGWHMIRHHCGYGGEPSGTRYTTWIQAWIHQCSGRGCWWRRLVHDRPSCMTGRRKEGRRASAQTGGGHSSVCRALASAGPQLVRDASLIAFAAAYSTQHEADAVQACCMPENPAAVRWSRATIRTTRRALRARCEGWLASLRPQLLQALPSRTPMHRPRWIIGHQAVPANEVKRRSAGPRTVDCLESG